MTDIRRTILWVIFGFSMVLLWDKWQEFNGKPASFFPSHKPAVTAAGAKGAATGASGVPAPAGIPGTAGAVPATAGATAAAGAVPTQSAAPAVREKVVINTDVYSATIDSEGATLTNLSLLRFNDLVDANKRVELFDNTSDATRYVAQTGVINQVEGNQFYPNHTTLMTPKPGPRSLEAGSDALEVGFESPVVNGVKYVKTYIFRRGDYSIGVRHEIVNAGTAPVSAQLYTQLLRHGTEAANSMFGTSTYNGPASYTSEKKFHKIDYKDIAKGKAELPPPATDGWISMVQHYFVAAWLLNGDSDKLSREFKVMGPDKLGTNMYSVAMVAKLPAIAPGATQVVNSTLYAGPQEEKKLEALAPGLELVKDYGVFAIIAKPLYWLLYALHSFIKNWGWSIVALVLLLKIAFYWLNAKAYASMAKMKAVNPKVMELRERLKDKPQEMQAAMMKIYRDEKVNPMGGCFPILIQIPVFIALYWVLLSSVEMRNAPWILWIKDLSSPDPYYILPVVMTLSTMLQTALNPAPPDPMQAKLMWFMPLVFSVMFFFFPAGLVLYWITNNILSIAQQWVINTRMGVPPQFNLPKFS
ncbi:MAG: membrane protein insertase YidC [Burkholderiales bacterium]|nr:MAG: membrane protein insertase YidC [Burkholderiales bacterium]